MITAENLSTKIKLSAQRALLGSITDSLRAVSIDVVEEKIYYRCIFKREPTENERDLLSVAATEVIADFSALHKIEEEYLVVTETEKIFHLKYLVFLKYEILNERI